MISKNLNQIKREIKKVINKMIEEKSIEYIEPFGFGHIFNDSYLGLRFSEYQSKEFQEISKTLEEYQNDLEKEKINEEAKNFLVLMKTDSSKFLWRLCLTNSGETQKFLEVPVLAQIDPKDFITAYIESPPRNRLDVHHTIQERYKVLHFTSKLTDEFKWLKKVDSGLKNKVSALKQPTRYHVEEFRLVIADVLSKSDGVISSNRNNKKQT